MPKGSRGGSKTGSGGSSANSVFNSDAKPVEVYNTRSRSGGNLWKRENLEAISSADGVIELGTPSYEYEQVNNNTLEARGTIKHGFVNTANGSMNGYWTGINWDNVKAVKGKTFNIKNELKKKGFKWDRDQKLWIKK